LVYDHQNAGQDTLTMEQKSDPRAYDAWFRAKVQEALDDPRPGIPNEEVETHFAKKRAASAARLQKSDSTFILKPSR
jgi:DNA-damage-inducible protein J